MRSILVPALFVLTISAANTQSLTVTAPAQAAPGATVTATITLTGSAGNIAGIQNAVTLSPSTVPFQITTPLTTKSSICLAGTPTGVCALIGILPAPTVSGTTITFSPNETFNGATIPDASVVQTVSFTVPPSMTSGTLTVSVAGVVASDANGNAIAVSGGSASITVSNPLVTAAKAAFTTWAGAQTAANFVAMIKAISAAQGF